MPFLLTIVDGKGSGERFRFAADRITLGRGADRDVVLNDAGVSRSHARIERRGGAWVLTDDGSVNGTELNGVLLAGVRRLRPGDRIGLGPVTFLFRPERAALRAFAPVTRLWGRLSLTTRIASGMCAALLLLCLARAAAAGGEAARGVSCPETVALDDDSAAFSFGHGAAEVDCGGQVVFGFEAGPGAHVLLHYTPLRVASPSELELRLNGTHLAWAPASRGQGEPQVIALPPGALAPDGRNFVALTESEKGKEWSVGAVRVERLAFTAGNVAAAREAYVKGRRKLEERRIAPRNLYDAWTAFTEARRQLEGLAHKPALYAEVARLIRDAERDLDQECRGLLFSAARFTRYGEEDKAQQAFREVLLHFPGDDPSGCRRQAEENLAQARAGEVP